MFAGVLLIFSGHVKKAVKNEAMDMAEQTLMSAVEYTENTLDKVETVARNMRWTVEHHLDRPDEMMGYCRTVLKYNEELKGCAVAFEPGYYKQKDECFMAYAYRTDEGSVTESNSYGNKVRREALQYANQVFHFKRDHVVFPFFSKFPEFSGLLYLDSIRKEEIIPIHISAFTKVIDKFRKSVYNYYENNSVKPYL